MNHEEDTSDDSTPSPTVLHTHRCLKPCYDLNTSTRAPAVTRGYTKLSTADEHYIRPLLRRVS